MVGGNPPQAHPLGTEKDTPLRWCLKKNFDWKLDERVKEWINLLSKDEKIKFMNSLNDELLENLYVWRLGFNIPELREDRITCLASV